MDEAIATIVSIPCHESMDNTTTLINNILNLLKSYVREKETSNSLGMENNGIQVALESLQHLSSNFIKWLPAFGCTIQALPSPNIGHSYLVLTYPDQWQTKISICRRGPTYTSTPRSKTSIDMGEISTDSIVKFWSDLEKEIHKQRNRLVREPPKTKCPHTIQACIRKVLSEDDKQKYPAYVGSTIIAESMSKSIAWPLIDAVFSERFMDSTEYMTFRLEFFIWLCKGSKLELNAISLETMFKFMSMIVFDILTNSASIPYLKSLDNGIQDVRKQLNHMYLESMRTVATRYNLSDDIDTSNIFFFDLDCPTKDQPSGNTLGTNNASRLTLQNSKSLPCVPKIPSVLFSKLIKWIEGFSTSQLKTTEFVLLILHTINTTMWSLAESLQNPNGYHLPIDEIISLGNLVHKYAGTLDAWLIGNGKNQHQTLFRSNQVLVSWICYCILHRECGLLYPLVLEFGSPLNWHHLKYLVLSDKRAMDAMVHVTAYLRKFNQDAQLFSLKNTIGTIEFSKKFAYDDISMVKKWECDQHELQRRKAKYMKQVEKKQNKVATLRRDINQLEQDLKEAKLTLEEANEDEREAYQHFRATRVRGVYDWNLHNARDAATDAFNIYKSIYQKLESKETERDEALKPPKFVTCPLPKSQDEAMSIIFFFCIPSALNVLANISCYAQYTFVPRAPHPQNCLEKLMFPLPPLTWLTHYTSNSKTEEEMNPSTAWTIYPDNLTVPSIWGPDNVDGMDCADKAFWHPPGNQLTFSWAGGLNPFMLTELQLEHFFTEPIPKPFDRLIWIMEWPHMDAIGSKRGNRSYSELDCIPDGFTKSKFLTLGSLRASPLLQLRRLIQCVYERSLPLDHPLTLKLFRQIMYQVGPISNDSKFLWKQDIDESHDGYETWYTILIDVIDETKDATSSHKGFLVLVEMADYLLQYYPNASLLFERLVHIAQQWAILIQTQLDSSGLKVVEERELLGKQRLMYGYGVIALVHNGFLSNKSNLLLLVKLLVRFREGLVIALGTNFESDMRMIEVEIHQRMVNHMESILKVLDTDARHEILTHAISTVLELEPCNLVWTLYPDTSVYSAIGTMHGKQVEYTVNALNGVILVNGNPLGRLPQIILDDPIYQNYFGEIDFDVVTITTNGTPIYCTNRYFDGFKYEFSYAFDHVCIRSIDEEDYFAFDLTATTWLSDLPPRLVEQYTHWIEYDKEIVVFRPPSMANRTIHFVATLDEKQLCYEMPTKCQSRDLQTILDDLKNYFYFVHHDTAPYLIKVLSKFEKTEFIHLQMKDVNGDRLLRCHLPRYGLTFEGNQLLRSLDYADYHLASQQQLDTMLPMFQDYLVLERTKKVPGQPSCMLLVPNGKVIAMDEMVRIDIDSSHDAILTVWSYPFAMFSNQLTTESNAARLQLAAIYSASSTCLPDPHLRMTGTEAAMMLVRQSWTSKPLTELEKKKLENLMEFSHHEPALVLLCSQLIIKSSYRSWMHSEIQSKHLWSDYINTAKSELRGWIESPEPWNQARRGLRQDEMVNVYGALQPRKCYKAPTPKAVQELPPLMGISWTMVDQFENDLKSLVSLTFSTTRRKYPMINKESSDIEKHVYESLKSSWEQYEQTPDAKIIHSYDGMKTILQWIAKTIQRSIGEIEIYLTSTLDTCVPSGYQEEIELLRACNIMPQLTRQDWLVIAFDISHIDHFNPYWATAAKEYYQRIVRLYLSMQVLLNRVERIQHLVETNASEAIIVRELTTTRTWSIDDHPRWLVFEAEGCLQIRPEQATIAKHLLSEASGTICQLNMGLGKTRVIMPMLIMEYLSRGEVPRVHILSSILPEAIDYLQLYLTASTLNIHIVELPFHRQVVMEARELAILNQTEPNACYVVAPEHRLSLEMKAQEWAYENHPLAAELKQVLCSQRFVDIFDECDALLHHRYQLVYAMGQPGPLDQCEIRALTAQALLMELNMCSESSELYEWISLHGVRESGSSNGGYNSIRLKSQIPEDDRLVFRRLLVTCMIDHPPMAELEWLQAFCSKYPQHQQKLVDTIVDKQLDTDSMKEAIVDEIHYASYLALRGYLGFGLLEHALEQRPRVQYGIDPNRQPKRLAVPFRAADVPSDRAEFGHPDISILLTSLGYYYQGLTEAQVMEAISVLFMMGHAARKATYDIWFDRIKDDLDPQSRSSIDNVSKLDKTNVLQMDLVTRTYAYSMDVINFWLRRCVFPTDLAQYAARISASSWNIAKSYRSVGFSGTNESNMILPLSVRAKEPPLPALLGTNGLMLDLLLNHTSGCHALEDGVVWRELLNLVVTHDYDALIDTGSLLAGISNMKVATYLLDEPKLHPRFQAIVYFDPSQKQWMSMHRVSRHTLSLRDSSIRECNSFVLFDDARTRGADMKLNASAIAALTLGIKLTKDKLMQGAGRLRLLGKSQKVSLIASHEVIGLLPSLSVQGILEWTVKNTAQYIESGMATWSQQGLFYSSSDRDENVSVVDDEWKLVDRFQGAYQSVVLSDTVREQVDNHHAGDVLAEAIAKQCQQFGSSLKVSLTYGEECERELQLEEEEEEEKVVNLLPQVPASEKIWSFESVVTARSIVEVAVVTSSIIDVLNKSWMGNSIAWPSKLFGTEAYFSTTVSPLTLNYARSVDAFLVLPLGDVIMVSEREADCISKLIEPTGLCYVNDKNRVPRTLLLHFGMLMRSLDQCLNQCGDISSLLESFNLSEMMFAALLVWNGRTSIGKKVRYDVFTKLLNDPKSRIAVKELVETRGELHNWEDSDLDKTCKRISLDQQYQVDEISP